MLIILNLISIDSLLKTVLYIATYLIIGYDILKEAWEGILKGELFDENF